MGIYGIIESVIKYGCSGRQLNWDIILPKNTGEKELEKAGFQYEGTLRNNAEKNGKAIDMKMYALLKEEML